VLRSVAVAASLALLAGCAADDSATTADDDSSDGTAPDRDPVESGVGIRASGCGLTDSLGSGVAVVEPGLVVTVAHTVAGSEAVTVVDVAGTEHDAAVIAFDPDADLAALSVPTLDAPPLEIGRVAAGEASTIRWQPDAGVTRADATITRRLGITIEDIFVEREVRRTGMELNADIVVGDSGGPVIDPMGAVVGIVYANSKSRPNIGFATDDEELRDLLASVDASAGDVDTRRCI